MPFIDLYDSPEDVGKVILAAQKAIVSHFVSEDWNELAYATGTQDYILQHDRLLRSLAWGDADYGSCVFQVLRRFSEQKVSAFEALVTHPKLLPDLEQSVGHILQRVGIVTGHVAPVTTEDLSAPQVVARALADADTLLRTTGPASCVDRVHTALHGYFRALCEQQTIPFEASASLPALFKLLRTQHKAFSTSGSQSQEVGRILNSFASAIDALSTLRNHASVAHPNDTLLGDPEASLAINAARTLFHYVRAKVASAN